jgi:hypothetical protein
MLNCGTKYLHNYKAPLLEQKLKKSLEGCTVIIHSTPAVMENCELGQLWYIGSLFAENASIRCFYYQHLNKFVSSVQLGVSINTFFTPKIPM